ncbi:hypothetical protein ACWGI1_22895 [Streptomyces sp. NPDC054835]|uniref:hypothetical protein n=1 Tax=Streptomyces sp. NBC_01268 TaxID=2903806 RepID=UPI002E359484|nr:hypothetical protein [Streptomyces sp. NBC_01268]
MHTDRGRLRCSSPDPDRLLRIYLSDHYAGSAAGHALARRMARAHHQGPAGHWLRALAGEIAEDRASLEGIMASLDVPVPRVRPLVMRCAEKLGRAKLNGRLFSRSPLSAVLELEALRLGVEGKLALWQSLSEIARSDERIDVTTVHHLADRAERQAGQLEDLRLAAVAMTLTPSARPTPLRAEASGRRRSHRPFVKIRWMP